MCSSCTWACRRKVECRSCFLPVLRSRRACMLLFITVHLHNHFWEGKNVFQCLIQMCTEILSSLTSLPTKCPTFPAVLPGSSIAYHLHSPLPSLCSRRKRPHVVSTAPISSEGTALSLCLLLSSQSLYRNVS